jgi:hypothetical protein
MFKNLFTHHRRPAARVRRPEPLPRMRWHS